MNKRRLETSLKMSSGKGILAFTVFGVVGYLITFLSLVFEGSDKIGTLKIFFGALFGAIFVGVSIILVMRLSRYFLLKLIEKNIILIK